jgi:hypothetical protein
MIIKNTKKKKNILFFSKFLKIYFFFTVILFILISLAFFNTGIWSNYKKTILNKIYVNGINNYAKIIDIGFSSLKSFFINSDELNINVSYENYLALETDRNEIINSSINGMRNDNHKFKVVSATIALKDSSAEGEIRLKGDRITHFDKEKSSYKITLAGEKKIMGIRKFSLIKPRARNYIHEWLFHELSSEGGLIKLQYEFVTLRVNGASRGLYVLEENFGRDLIERNKRRDGPIFSLMEEFSNFAANSKLEIYNKKYWSRSENDQIARSAEIKIQNFFQGKVSAKDVLDLKKWFWYFAVSDLTYTHHGLSPRNVKFYYNPLSGLTEPIPYDGHRSAPNYSEHIKDFDNGLAFDKATYCLNNMQECIDDENETGIFLVNFFYDKNKKLIPDNYVLYKSSLLKISSKEYLDKFFNKRKKKIHQINSKIYSDYFLIDNLRYLKYGPGFYYFSENDLKERARSIKNRIKHEVSKINIIEDSKLITIRNNKSVNNLSVFPVELICEKSFQGNKYSYNKKLKSISKFNLNNQIIVDKSFFDTNVRCQYVRFQDLNENLTFLKSVHFIENSKNRKNFKKDLVGFKKYFEVKGRYVMLKNDYTVIEQDLYIPKKFTVKILPGQKIKLKNTSIIFSDSPWVAGEKNKKKVYIGGDKDEFGGGLIINSTLEKKSIFNNVIFSYLYGANNRIIYNNENTQVISSKYLGYNKYQNKILDINAEDVIRFNGHKFFGALNFYKSNVEIKDCTFSNVNSEDALNIISSEFKIENSYFNQNASDSIDIDFSNGKIENVKISYSGNDGIDLSGSKIILKDIEVLSIGDKSVSVGENAFIEINNIVINDSFIGIANKDGSRTTVKNLSIKNTKIPLASYRKKTAYDFGKLIVKKPFKIENYIVKVLKDKKSIVIIDNQKIKKSNANPLEIVYKKNVKLLSQLN